MSRRYGGTAVRRYEGTVSRGPAGRRVGGRLVGNRPSAGPPVRPPLMLLVLLLVGSPLHAQDQIGLPLGATPEAVAVEDLDGNAVDLGQWIGKQPVVVQFWATWCPVCEELGPRIRAARAKHGEAVAFLVVAVGVNQSPRRVRRYLDEHPDMGTIVWDGKGAAVRAFEAPGTSYVVGLDKSGKVVYTGFGADQDIAEAFSAAIR